MSCLEYNTEKMRVIWNSQGAGGGFPDISATCDGAEGVG